MRHGVNAWLAVMPDELLTIRFTANSAAETITPQNAIEQALKVFARMPLSAIATGAEPATYGVSTATA
jgi:hypothetical protein